MFNEIRAVIDRARPTILQDLLGGVSLLVVLVVTLHIPDLIS